MTKLDTTISELEDRIRFYQDALRKLKTLRAVRKLRSKGLSVADYAEKIANGKYL